MIALSLRNPLSLTKLATQHHKIDALEFWLDQYSGKIPKTSKKIILVCKDKREQGKFSGSSQEKVDRLLVAGQADYYDLGIHTFAREIQRLRKLKGRAKLILSFHDFIKTPGRQRLGKIVERMRQRGADVVKIATMVTRLSDNERLIEFALHLTAKKIPHIVIGMGKMGVITRIFSKQLGNEMTFVAGEHQTAPGQLGVGEMRDLLSMFSGRQVRNEKKKK